MAVRKTSSGKGRPGTRNHPKKSPGGKSLAPLFWVIFFILIAGLFLVNRELIRKTLGNTQLLDRVSNRSRREEPEPPPVPPPPPAVPPAAAPVSPEEPERSSPRRSPETPSPAANQPVPPQPAAPPTTEQPAPSQSPAGQREPPKPETVRRERAVYFTQIDREGTILRYKATRNIQVSDSPMLDALNALLQGPTAEEQRRGLVSLIPSGTRILSATVRGNTAYISFSEEFQYNTYGVEGYAAQLKQIVWTATEFPNVRDVQILIEGRRVDYLGEGIWIGSPINRDGL
ncbi:MAG: GerMN domain-containing protein [Treponema sp.]|nr:GerMN domain-containing protein [Treponema sp.]